MPEYVCVPGHKKEIMAVHDAMDVLNGKWKISIISSICITTREGFRIS
jgi:DNA-binding HxlR family transcriptional regulator